MVGDREGVESPTPRQIDQLGLGRIPRTGEQCLAYLRCREIADQSATYEFTVVGDDGGLIVRAHGYHKVILMRAGGKQ